MTVPLNKSGRFLQHLSSDAKKERGYKTGIKSDTSQQVSAETTLQNGYYVKGS